MALAEVRQLSISNIHASPVAVPGFSIIDPGKSCLRLMTTHEIELLIPGLDALVADTKITYTTDVGSGGGTLTLKDQGVVLGEIDCLNFVGTDVQALMTGATEATVYVPSLSLVASHWNTSDGAGDRTVTESIVRESAWIPVPNPSEGSPYTTGGWAGTTQVATQDTVVVFQANGPVRGFSPPSPAPGDASFTVEVFDADGTTLLETYTTTTLNGDLTHVSPSTNITVDVTGYALTGSQYAATLTATVAIATILANTGRTGGRYHIRTTFSVDTLTDDVGGTFIHTQPSVFLDTNPTTPTLATVSLSETAGSVVTKHLSGIEYYALFSQFTAAVTDIDQLNRNTTHPTAALTLTGTTYGFPSVEASPAGPLSGAFSGWTTAHDVDNVSFSYPTWSITATDYRYVGSVAKVSAQLRDPWTAVAAVDSSNAQVLVDTYTSTSTDTFEGFDDEEYRETSAFPGVGTWNSNATLTAGEALVHNSLLSVPHTDWTGYAPSVGGTNPDYSAFTAPVTYYRRWINAPGLIPSFNMVFTGTFAAGSALADMLAGNLEVEVYRVGGQGNVGPPPGNTTPLRMHLPFNYALYDDGASSAGSGIRESSSNTNQINCTFGTGTPSDGGMYTCVRILNAGTTIDSITVSFF